MKTLTLPIGCNNIHSINDQHEHREIKFKGNCSYAVVLASYYGGKGYTTHASMHNAAKCAKRLNKYGYSYKIIDDSGNQYMLDCANDGRPTLARCYDLPAIVTI